MVFSSMENILIPLFYGTGLSYILSVVGVFSNNVASLGVITVCLLIGEICKVVAFFNGITDSFF